MKLLSVFSIILYFHPISVSSRAVPESFPELRLLIREPGIPDESGVREPEDLLPRPPKGPGLGENRLPQQGAQTQDGLTWVRFVQENRPHYQLSTEEISQELNDQHPVSVGIAYYKETGAVELILRPSSDSPWLRGSGHRFYLDPRNDAGGTQRLLVVSADVKLDPMDILATAQDAEPAVNDIIRYYSSPNLDFNQVQATLEDAYLAAEPDIENVPGITAAFIAIRMGQAIRLLRIQETGKAPEDEAGLGLSKLSIGVQGNERRAIPIDTIESQESTASSDYKSKADYTSEFQNYLDVFFILQAEISSLLFPVLNELITGSNSSLVHQIAWSIWSDLTISTQRVIGPFMYGLSSLTWIEDAYFNSTHKAINANGTMVMGRNDSVGIAHLAVFGALEQLYLTTWEKAINATNSTGLLADLDLLVTYLQPADTSICPPGFLNASNSNIAKGAYRVMAPPAKVNSYNSTQKMR